MGFVGKPSKACEPCRSRRTRCDQQKPRCGQCVRKSVSCVFRDPVDLAFRNENETVARRVNLGQTDGDDGILPDATVVEDFSEALELNSLVRALSETTEDVATTFFFSKWSQGIYNDYVPALYQRTDCSAVLRSSVEAIGLATLSISRSEASLMIEARKSHVVALRRVQKAISSWETARRADTLAAIMLLALFAGITGEPDAARTNWTKHVRGALAVLNARLDEKDSDPAVSILSSHVVACVLVDCLQSAIGPPKQFQNLKFERRIPSSFQQKSEYILQSLALLRQTSVSDSTITRILKDLDKIDEELDNLMEILPSDYPMTVEEQEFGIHEPPLHTYAGRNPVCSSRMWNIVRITKLSAFELRYDKMLEMQEYKKATSEESELNYQQQLIYASNAAADVILDLCASVPACLRSRDVTNHHDLMNWCHALLWPLSAAQASPHIPISLHHFVHRQLQLLWDTSQLTIVDYHQEDMKDGLKPHMWTHVFFIC